MTEQVKISDKDEMVSLKVIDLSSLKDATSREMLQSQVSCLSAVRHPNVLALKDSFRTVNNCYIITQFCEGGDLAKHLKLHGPLSQIKAKTLFLQLLNGYQAIIQSGYLHRDLKPANILISGSGVLKIADFGFCKRQNGIQKQNYNVGTPIYMPRESLMENIYNQKTQIWSLGVILYQMLFATLPFKGKNEAQLKLNLQKGQFVIPSDKNISNQLISFLRSILTNSPILRLSLRQCLQHPWLKSQQQQFKRRKIVSTNDLSLRVSLPIRNNTNNKEQKTTGSIQKLKLVIAGKKSPSFSSRGASSQTSLHYKSKTTDQSYPQKQNIKNPTIIKKHQKMLSLAKDSEKQNGGRHNEIKQTRETKSIPLKNIQNMELVQTQNISYIKQIINKDDNIIQGLLALINYFRFIYRIIEKLRHSSLISMKRYLQQKLNTNFSFHLLVINEKTNYFKFNKRNWIQFLATPKWQSYRYVINQYKQKYQKIINNHYQFYQNQKFIQEFVKIVKQQRQNKNLETIQILHVIKSFIQLQKMKQNKNWIEFALILEKEPHLCDQTRSLNKNIQQLKHQLDLFINL